MSRRSALLRLLTSGALAWTLAACGSTVPGVETAAPAVTATDQGLAAAGAATESAAVPGATTVDPTAPSGAGATGGQGDAGGTTAPAAGPAAAPAPVARGGTAAPSRRGGQRGQDAPSGAAAGPTNGVSDSEIKVGFAVNVDAAAANSALGVEVAQSDQKELVRILTEQINKSGGVAGRKLVAVVHEFDANSAQTIPEQEQAACSTWTDDNQVFAAVFHGGQTDTLRSCLADRGVEMVGYSLTASDDHTFAQFPYLEPSNPSGSAVAAQLADGLHRLGYYEPETPAGPKIGLMRFDIPEHERQAAVLKQRLAHHGLELTDEVAVREPQSNAENGDMVAQIQNAVLQFRSNGVDHVVMLDKGAAIAIFFMRSAENQGYRPQYGLNTNNGNQLLIGVVPPDQVRDAYGVGWWPMVDVPAAKDPGLTSAGKRCMQIMRRSGQQPGDRNAQGQMLNFCGVFFFLQQALDPSLGPIAPGRLSAGADRLGTRYVSTTTFGTSLGPDKHHGAAFWRGLRFRDSCDCFEYVTGNRRF